MPAFLTKLLASMGVDHKTGAKFTDSSASEDLTAGGSVVVAPVSAKSGGIMMVLWFCLFAIETTLYSCVLSQAQWCERHCRWLQCLATRLRLHLPTAPRCTLSSFVCSQRSLAAV